jgi:hypothetical protein
LKEYAAGEMLLVDYNHLKLNIKKVNSFELRGREI